MSKDSFVKNSILLTLTNLVTGIFRFVFAIYLSRTIGAEGMGLYGLIMPIYDLFCCLICGGMMTAISKEAANYLGKNELVNIKKTIRISLKFDFFWSIFILIFVFLSSNLISTYIIKDARSVYSIWLLCPAVLFVALSSILKGYFYGMGTATIPAIIDIGEKIVRIIALIMLMNFFKIKDVTAGVTLTYASLAIGEFVSFLFLYIFYKYKTKNTFYNSISHKSESSPQILYNILAISIPLSINGFLTTSLSTVSKLVIPTRLMSAGLTHSQSLEVIGKFSEMAMTIIYFPMIVIMSVSLILIPDLSKSISQGKVYSVEKRIKSVLNLSLILGLCTMLLGMTCPDSLGRLFFRRSDLGEFIFISSFSAPVIFLSATTYGILNGFGKQKIVLRNSIISAVVQLVLCYVLIGIPSLNIYGYALAMMISGFLGFVLNLYEINREMFLDFDLGKISLYLCIALLAYYILKVLIFTLPQATYATDMILVVTGFAIFGLGSFVVSKFSKN